MIFNRFAKGELSTKARMLSDIANLLACLEPCRREDEFAFDNNAPAEISLSPVKNIASTCPARQRFSSEQEKSVSLQHAEVDRQVFFTKHSEAQTVLLDLSSRQAVTISENVSAKREAAYLQRRVSEITPSIAIKENRPAPYNNSVPIAQTPRHRDLPRGEQFTREERDALAEQVLRENDF